MPQQQKRRLNMKAELENIAMADLSELGSMIRDHVRPHGQVTTPEMVRAVGGSGN